MLILYYILLLLVRLTDECKDLSNNSEKLKMAVNRWNLLTAEERKTWTEKAEGLNNLDVSELTEKQRKQQIKKVKKQLTSQVCTVQGVLRDLYYIQRDVALPNNS